MSGEELAAEAQISAAKRRAVEVRAEAAMLVEAVENRAFSVSASPHLFRRLEGLRLLVGFHAPVMLRGAMRNLPT